LATRQPFEERSTQGPTAEEMWKARVWVNSGREPTFEERRHWEAQMEEATTAYLREHPEKANALDVSTFRFHRQLTVGMDKQQVLILLGAPGATTSDQLQMEQMARRYWPELRGNVTEAWVYPLGWVVYFAGPRVIDITQYIPPR
jgi:hypothetical protein